MRFSRCRCAFAVGLTTLWMVSCGGGGGGSASMTTDPPAGTLDTAFDGDGKVTTAVGSVMDAIQGVAIDGSGRIVAVGYSTVDSHRDFAVARYNADGSLDTTFNASGPKPGVLTTSTDPNDDEAYGVAIQSDGKIVVAGYGYNYGHRRVVVARYTAAGTLDAPAFTASGFATLQIENDSRAYAVALQSDGKIVIGGYSGSLTEPYPNRFALARFNTNGTLDTTFNTGGSTPGTVVTPVGSTDDRIHALAIVGGDAIYAAGYSSNGSTNRFAVARYTSSGTLDTAFNPSGGTPGTVVTLMGSGNASANAIAVSSAGVLVAGKAYNGATDDFALVRYTTAGDLDPSFDVDGKVMTDVTVGRPDEATAVAVAGDGRIWAAGTTQDASFRYFALVRYEADGSIDETLNAAGTPGRLAISLGTEDSTCYGMAVQPADGKVVLAGSAETASGVEFALARVWP